jgi:F-type H+-transporting ATPase subunit b
MENLLNISPGLMIWTLFNFFIVLFIVIKFGVKPIVNGLNSRENGIREAIENAEKANAEAQTLLKESQEKLRNAQSEMSEIIQKGRVQAEEIVRKAADDAEKVKKQKVEDAVKEIERSKEAAILELRKEVAGLVVVATEKLLNETLDKDKHYKLVESYIDKLPKN